MSQEQSPDGQPQTPTSSEPDADAGGTPEPIRDMAEAKRIIAQRDALKAERDALRAQRDKLDADRVAAERAKAEAEGNLRGVVESLQAELKAKEQAQAELATKLEQRDRTDRRRDFTDVILGRAHEQHREELRLMLPGLHEDGELDLYADKPAALRAAEKLAKRYPEKFRPADGAQQGGAQAPAGKRIPDGVKFQDLPPDMQRSMSDEEFEKRYGRGAAKRSGLAF